VKRLILPLLLLTLAACGKPHTFEYRDLLTNASISVDLDAGEITDGHSVWPLTKCDTKFDCISSAGLTFAAPREFENIPATWTAGGFGYKLVGKRNVATLGRAVDAYLIEQASPGRVWFLYSPEHGVLGMGSLAGEKPSFYWLRGRCGFAGRCSRRS
jgi:hypothetical protein